MSKESLIRNRAKSVKFAFKGLWILICTERSIQIQLAIACIVTCFGFYWTIEPHEWMMQLLAIGLVMGLEGVNTAIEKLADFVQPHNDAKIGLLKDVSAGAVMLGSIVASIVGLIIYLPRWI
ncbi:MAG: hypothetical protein RLZZ241_1830 [Bacteroidota bacterium]